MKTIHFMVAQKKIDNRQEVDLGLDLGRFFGRRFKKKS